ncbi:hypothetical protein DID78_03755, partial [Candidatus Marinamargulisbacteria bacterium SCGC AG-343-D04]
MKAVAGTGSESTLVESRRGKLWALRLPGPSADCLSAKVQAFFCFLFLRYKKSRPGLLGGGSPPNQVSKKTTTPY